MRAAIPIPGGWKGSVTCVGSAEHKAHCWLIAVPCHRMGIPPLVAGTSTKPKALVPDPRESDLQAGSRGLEVAEGKSDKSRRCHTPVNGQP